MAVNLNKGGRINLSKENPGLKNVMFAMGWKCNNSGWDEYDLDMSAFLLDENGVATKDGCVFYGNNKQHKPYVVYGGDNLTGSTGDNDDETIIIDLTKVPAKYKKISFVVDIYNAKSKGQHFGKVSNAYIRAINTKNNQELLRFNLSDSYDGNRGIYVAELERVNGEWEFKAIGNGVNHGLPQMKDNFKSGASTPSAEITTPSTPSASQSVQETVVEAPRRKKFLGIF